MPGNSADHVPTKIAIIGVGNTLRADDGVGAYICSEIELLCLPGVTIRNVHQLHVELIEDLLDYDSVIIVDASVAGKAVEFVALSTVETQAVSSSHHLNANMLHALTKKMYGKNIPIFLCSVRCENFEMGEILSANAITNAKKAIEIICNWTKK